MCRNPGARRLIRRTMILSRLPFFALAAGAGLFLSACAGFGRPPVAAHYDLLIGGYTEGSAGAGRRRGVEVYRFDTATGGLTFLRENAGIRNPSWLLAHDAGRTVYTVNELNGGGAGRVSAFRFDAVSGTLTFLNDAASGGDDPCHLAFDGPAASASRDVPECVDRQAPHAVKLYVSNYSSGGMKALAVDVDGRFAGEGAASASVSVPAGARSHMHSTALAGGVVYVADLGTDRILRRRHRGPELVDAGECRLPAGTGPRHLVFDRSGKNAYVVGELNDSVTHLVSTDENLSIAATYPLGAPSAFKKGTAAAVRLSDDGRFLYASTRDPKNAVHVFAVDAVTGALTDVQTIASGGRAPRDIVLSPDGRFLLAANQKSDGIAVFARDPQSGRLAGPLKTLRSGSPSALVWVAAP